MAIGTAARHESLPRPRRFFLAVLALLAFLATAVAGVAWWYHTTRPDYQLRQGQQALRQGRMDKVERLVQRLEAEGYADQAHLLRGEALLREHRFPEAITEFNALQDRGNLRVEAAAIYGLAFLSVKRPFEAEQLLRFVVARQPDHLEAQRGLAAIYFDQGSLTLAVQHAQECARLEPTKGYPYWLQGVIFKDLSQYPEAHTAFQEALQRELTPSQTREVQEGLAEVLVLQKEYAPAFALLETCPPALTSKPKMLACRAECLWGTERGTEAKRLLDEAIREHPQAPELLRLRAKFCLSDNDPKSAAGLLERALQVDPHDSVSRYEMVQAQQMLGQAAEAARQQQLLKQTQEYFAELTKLNADVAERPWDAAVRVRLAEVCERLGKTELASMWREAAAAGPPPAVGK